MRPNVRAWRLSAAALFIAAAAIPAAAADKPCSKADAANAEKAIDKVVSWPMMQKSVKDFGHCDTGNAANLFTESLLRLLVGGWPKIKELEPLFNNDTAFREWILKRLSDPALPGGDADDVHDLSQNSCPKAQKNLCEALHGAVEAGKNAAAPKPAAAPTPAASPAPAAPGTAPAAVPEAAKPKS
jgi:hypothetical protein